MTEGWGVKVEQQKSVGTICKSGKRDEERWMDFEAKLRPICSVKSKVMVVMVQWKAGEG